MLSPNPPLLRRWISRSVADSQPQTRTTPTAITAAPPTSTSTFSHIGVEGEFHFVKDSSDLYEKTYEVGGRYFRTYRKFVPYGKVMYGRGVFNFPPLGDGFRANLAYNLVAAGIGVDYKVKRYVYVRADWEYQNWFGFQNSSLSPSILTIGAAYHFK